MEKTNKLTIEDLRNIETDIEKSIALIRKYASCYVSKIHYQELGRSCVMSVVNTVDTVIGSAEYLEGEFIMPDQIHVERLASWFIKCKGYEGNEDILLFFMADYIKRKINELYRLVKQSEGTLSTTFRIFGDKAALKKLKAEIKIRKQNGVRPIRLTRISS